MIKNNYYLQYHIVKFVKLNIIIIIHILKIISIFQNFIIILVINISINFVCSIRDQWGLRIIKIVYLIIIKNNELIVIN
jgi:hypothetical protein